MTAQDTAPDGDDTRPMRTTTPTRATAHDTADTTKRSRAVRDLEMLVAWIAFAAYAVIAALAACGVMRPLAANSGKAGIYSWFAPESYVQLIWIPIDALLAVWLLRLSRSRTRGRKVGHTPFTVRGILFILACLVGIAWVFSWQAQSYPAAITLVIVQAVLVGLLFLMARRGKQRSVWDWAPFSLWGSWLVMECVVDIARACTYYLAKDGPLSDTGQSLATIIVAALLLALACALRFANHDWVYGLVTLWSVVGIGLRLMDVSKLTAGLVIILATLAAILMYVPWSRISGRLSSLDHAGRHPTDPHTAHTPPTVIEGTASPAQPGQAAHADTPTQEPRR